MRYLVLSVLICPPSWAGLVVNGNLTQNGKAGPLKQYYQGDQARLQYPSQNAEPNWLTYHAGTGTIHIVDSAKKTVLELNEKDLTRLGGLFSMMPGVKKPGAKIKAGALKYKKEGAHTVGKFKCTRYSILHNGTKNGELCVVPLETVGATAADMKPLASLAKTFTSLSALAPEQSALLGMGLDEALKLGFMVELKSLDAAGKPTSHLVVENVQKETIQDSVFQNPEGFTKNDLGGLLQGMMMKASRK